MRITVLLFLLLSSVSMFAQETCMQPDVNCDGYVNVNDLIGLLVYFGDEDLDGDGIWDSQDDCVEDECGVCDGPGPQVLAVDTITFTVDSIFVEAIDEWYVFEVPDTTFAFVCSNPGCTNPTSENFNPYASEDDGSCIGGDPCANELTVMFDGYEYDLVEIGEQCWFAENLRTEIYLNGDSIQSMLSDSLWAFTDSGAVAVYGESGCWNESEDGEEIVYDPDCDSELYLEQYGRLYNWLAVSDERGLCPTGWHVPTDGEWTSLEIELGMEDLGIDLVRGPDIATQMKSSPVDVPYWDGSNSSSFSALPGGKRNPLIDTSSSGEGSSAHFWTASGGDAYAWARYMFSSAPYAFRYDFDELNYGFSVRCLKD